MLSELISLCGGPGGAIKCGVLIFLVLLLNWFEVRLFSILSIIFLGLLTVRYNDPHQPTFSIEDCPIFNTNAFVELRKFRTEQPGKFCAFGCVAFILLALVGNIIPGKVFVTVGVICGLTIPAKKYIPANWQKAFSQPETWVAVNDSEVEEFLPELTEQNIEVLNRAQGALKSDSDNESDKSSDALLLDKTPNLSLSSSEAEDDIIPSVKDIEFKSGYFNGDSSTDDDSYTKGLKFTDQPSIIEPDSYNQQNVLQLQDHTQALTGLISNISRIVPWGIVTNMIASTTAPISETESIKRKYTDSSDDSDFELVNTEDLNS